MMKSFYESCNQHMSKYAKQRMIEWESELGCEEVLARIRDRKDLSEAEVRMLEEDVKAATKQKFDPVQHKLVLLDAGEIEDLEKNFSDLYPATKKVFEFTNIRDEHVLLPLSYNDFCEYEMSKFYGGRDIQANKKTLEFLSAKGGADVLKSYIDMAVCTTVAKVHKNMYSEYKKVNADSMLTELHKVAWKVFMAGSFRDDVTAAYV